ncbi:MAG TPA: M48 family metallopeptidase [Verrucomicrobiae bacterium]|nr:M48 family metallopeptidase [Verrucomicrobiae bacterium]
MQQPDFFAREDLARRHTKLLEVYFLLAIIGTIVLTYAAVAFVFALKGGNPFNPGLFAAVVCGTLAVIIGGSLYKTTQLASGGSAVAEMLGGKPVNANTADTDERKFLNVVEEMSIASGTPVPQLYVLPGELGINAFAAGHSTNDMVICATRGALKCLKRDELQGVIGHEFSHILNGDMKLNLRLMSLVFGLLCLAIFGRILLRTRGQKNPLPLLGLALLAAGSLGVFFGKLIKSAVSRQREFLADASAVQFTRNPLGLANALKKVGGAGSCIDDPNAEDASHLFFANGLGESIANMFSTHPPLEERIRALDPTWDGKFIPMDPSLYQLEETHAPTHTVPPMISSATRAIRPAQFTGVIGAATAAATFGSMALRTPHAALSYAADWRSKLPPALDTAAREPMSAVALVYALLLSRDAAMRASQLQQLQKQSAPGICDETVKLFTNVADLESRARLPLVSLSMTALRRLSPAQFAEFERNIQYLIQSDQQVELFEYTLQKIVLRRLEANFIPPKHAIVQYYVLKPLLPDAAVLLSALAYAGQNDAAQIENAFRLGAMKLNVPELALCAPEDNNFQQIDIALNRLNQAAPPVKNLVLNACAETVAADGVIQEGEAELLRAIADTLDCHIPPFLHIDETG